MEDKDPLFQQAYFLSQIMKERFRNQDGKLKELRLLLEKGISQKIDTGTLISKASILLGEENEDLLRKLKFFIPTEKSKSSIGDIVKPCLDLLNLAQIVFGGKTQHYNSFIGAIVDFGKDKDVNRLKRKTNPLLRKHPELDIAFSEFFDSEIDPKRSKHGGLFENDNEIEFYKNPGPHSDNFKGRIHNMYEKNLFDCEEDIFESDLFENKLMSVVEASTNLIVNNKSKRLDPKGEIVIGKYFSHVHLRFLKDELGKKYSFLSVDLEMLREKAVTVAKEISCSLIKKFEEFDSFRGHRKEKWAKIMQKNSKKAIMEMKIDWKSG